MASFVTEILASSGKLGKEDISIKIANLSKHVNDVKNQVQETLDSRYLSFFPILNETLELSSKVKNVSNETEILTNRIENEISNQLQISAHEIQELSRQLSEISVTIKIIHKLMTIHELLVSISDNLQKKDYLFAAESLEEIKSLLMDKNYVCEDQIKIFQALKTEYVVRREKLMYDLGERWNEFILWKMDDSDADYTSVLLTMNLSNASKIAEITSLMKAMQLINYLDPKLKMFSTYFINHICKPILCSQVDIEITSKETGLSAHLRINNNSKKPVASEAFDKLTEVFDFLGKTLTKIKLSDEKNVTFMTKLGQWASEDFCALLIKECLSEAIPSNKNDLKSYHEIIEQTTKFQNILSDYAFLSPDQGTILEYARNVDILFANKMCQDILEKARKLMLADLHETVYVKPEMFPVKEIMIYITEDLSKTAPINIEQSSNAPAEKLSKNIFKFPFCAISQSVENIMKMVYDAINEATSSSSLCAVRLFYVARNIIELFCDVVPVFHKDNLSRLPQLSALHHNNCMFIAHHMMTLGHHFHRHLPLPLKDNFTTFLDLIPRVRKLGVEIFLAQMLEQKQMLKLHDQEGINNLINEAEFLSLERAINRALHQLFFLQRLWAPVLPVNVYYKSIGTLLNSFIEELLYHICSQEDIPSDYTLQLTSIFSRITTKAPLLFKVENEERKSATDVHQYVAKWMKFKELLLILGASMKDILDRWAEGKGPLAHEFTVNEIKQLIRALFQNTDLRAATLAKIKQNTKTM